MLPGAPTSLSVHKELRGAVRGLDGFYGTLALGFMGLEGPLEAPKKILRPKGAPEKILRNEGAPKGLPTVQESPKKIFFSH